MSVSMPEATRFCGGIDLGGTKVESKLFNSAMDEIASRRRPTPRDNYNSLVDLLVEEVNWLHEQSGDADIPVGVGVPGLIDPQSGHSVTANLPATGHPLQADLASHVQGSVRVENDCKCFALSEANGGSGSGYARVFGLIIGTGLGGGFCQLGRLETGTNGVSGEVGHIALPANLVSELNLPLLTCGCGRTGCYETLVSGPGLGVLAKAATGTLMSGKEISQHAQGGSVVHGDVLAVWYRLVAELIHTIQLTLDPECIIVGGGLSNLPGLASTLSATLDDVLMPSLRKPMILTPVFGDSSGARGAALLACTQPTKGDDEQAG